MLPEFPSAAQIFEYLCDLEYLFSRMNVGSYGPTELHLSLVGKIPTSTWEDCRPPQRGRDGPISTMILWTCSSNCPLRGGMTPIRKDSSTDTWVKVPMLPLNVPREKDLKITLT